MLKEHDSTPWWWGSATRSGSSGLKGMTWAPGSRLSGRERLEMFQFVGATLNRLAATVKGPIHCLAEVMKVLLLRGLRRSRAVGKSRSVQPVDRLEHANS